MLIAVYGGVGSGKSHVSRHLVEKNNGILLEADKIAAALYEKGKSGYKAVVKICGKSVLDPHKRIDRKLLADILYSNPGKLYKINKAIHPMVYSECRRIIKEAYKSDPEKLIVYEAAIHSHHFACFDSIWLITASYENRLKRTAESRGYTKEKLDSIIDNQPSEEYYRSLADIVIENNGTKEELEKKADEALEYCKRKLR